MYLYYPILAFVLAQILKLIVEMVKDGRIDFRRIVDAGGMPSAHAAGTVALCTALWRDLGVHSPVVAVAITFTLVVLYDAAGIRRAAGRQAVVLNKIVDELMHHKHVREERLKELLGHTPLEVIMGIILGIVIGIYG